MKAIKWAGAGASLLAPAYHNLITNVRTGCRRQRKSPNTLGQDCECRAGMEQSWLSCVVVPQRGMKVYYESSASGRTDGQACLSGYADICRLRLYECGLRRRRNVKHEYRRQMASAAGTELSGFHSWQCRALRAHMSLSLKIWRPFMNFKQLYYFTAIAETGSISAAAHKLGLSQPPLSRQLSQLEENLDTPLFKRSGHGIELTGAGQVLYYRAKDILSMMDAAALEVRSFHEGLSGTLKNWLHFLQRNTYNPAYVCLYKTVSFNYD